MEGTRTEISSESQPVEDPPTTKFTWKIDNFSRLTVKKLYSTSFELGDYKWRVLIYPKGNNTDYLSMYLDVADSANLPNGWTRYAHFSLAVVNQVHSKYSVKKETQHQFNARENDWGFTSFMSLGELYDPSRGFIVDDTCVIEAEVSVYKAMEHLLYDSKKETGFVGPQPMEAMEGTRTEISSESQPVEDPPTTKFTWKIDNFSRLTVKKLYSTSFELGDYKWRVLIYPKGNNTDYLSMYLDVADSANLPNGWTRYAHFSLAVVNQVHSKYSVKKETQHQFNARENDWGFTSFMSLGELYDPSRGFIVDDTCVIEAEVSVYKAMEHLLYDSKKETGFVGPQPMEAMEGTRTEISSESQPVEDPPTTKFTWKIDNFSRLTVKKLYSTSFELGDYKWRVLIYPKGNNTDYLSMYLDVADSANLPNGWTRYAHFSLAVVNQVHSKYSVKKETQHQFNARENDWGFTSFMSLGELYDPSRGFIVDDTCVIEAEVAVYKAMEHLLYDSKKETGFVGLKNQGATCYMNSLLQTLYHIPYFRKAVYHMPTNVNDVPSASISLALQSLFYKLQYSDGSVATKELTKSFGWDSYDAFLQHDVQELNRVLCEKLEEKMKRTVVEGAIQQLFEGHHMNYIECINVDYRSSRKESFYDLQLDVKDCHDVYASFDKYVSVEHLDGDNKYHAEQHGLQDARKGVLFVDFPPVLQLHLKRFEYDFARDIMVKINDRYEFPFQLDLDRDDGKYLSPDADRRVRNLYTLHSVLVHSGGVHGGHYYAFIRPTLTGQWYKFDDERVTKEDMKKALDELFGGEEEHVMQTNPGVNITPFKFTNHSNAYMLVYIRDSDKDKILCNVDENDIAAHLRERLKREQEEKEQKKKEKTKAHLYAIVKVARDEDFGRQIGSDIFFDLVDHDKVKSFRVQKLMPFNVFKEEVAREFGIPVQFQRFWLWAKWQNHTYRPNRPLTILEEAHTVGHIRKVSNKVQNAELKLFLEVEFGPDLRPISFPSKAKDDILLFFKLYDPVKEELRYAGRLFVKYAGKPIDILAKLNEMAGYTADEDIDLYEEIKFDPNVMCEPVDKRIPFKNSQLEDGDIICFQKSLSIQTVQQLRCPDVPSFFEYRHNLQVIHFRALEKPKEEGFSLQLSKLYTYDDVVEKVANKLGVDDPSKIRLTSHNTYSQQPKPHPIKYRGVDNLLEMLLHYNQTSDILYYEILDMPLPELQGLRTLKVAFRKATNNEIEVHNIRVPKESNVGDVLDELKIKVTMRPVLDLSCSNMDEGDEEEQEHEEGSSHPQTEREMHQNAPPSDLYVLMQQMQCSIEANHAAQMAYLAQIQDEHRAYQAEARSRWDDIDRRFASWRGFQDPPPPEH